MKLSNEENRLGLALWPGTPARETLRIGKLADEAGLDSLWITESTLAPGRDAISILGALSASTSRTRLATGIINIFTRSPTLIASTAATLDELSEGRAVLGLGTGHQDPLTKWHSVHFEKPITRMRDYVEVIRRVLEGGKVDYRGSTVAVQDFKLAMKPQRQVPVYLATVGPKMARLAGEIADGALVTMNTLPQLKKLASIATTTASGRGRMLDVAAYSLSFVSEDHEENVRTAKRVLAMYCSAAFYNKVFAAAGYEKEAGEIARLWAASDKEAAYDLVTEGMIRNFAAVGVEEAVRMVRLYREAGVTLPVISLVHVEDFEQSVTRLFSQLAA